MSLYRTQRKKWRERQFLKNKTRHSLELGFRTLNIFVNKLFVSNHFNELHSLLRASNSGPLLYSGHVFLFHLLVGG